MIAELSLVVDLGIGESLSEASGIVQYLLVFIFAAIPWVEILVVIPIAIGLGLNPFFVGIFAFVGNIATVYLLIIFHRRIATWWAERKSRDPDKPTENDDTGRSSRARQLWKKYGIAGLALAAPIVTGVHLAAFIAMLAGSRGRVVGWWMTVSMAIWTVVIVIVSIYGLGFLGII